MEKDDFDILDQAIPILEAQNLLALLPVLNFSKLKKKNRDTVHRELLRAAYPGMLQERKPLTIENARELQQMLALRTGRAR